MQHPSEIDVQAARARLDAGGSLFIDIRDPDAYRAARIPGAVHLTDRNIEEFLAQTDPATPIVVYCYHGISSVGAAGFFLDQGFEHVVSMSGGFSAWGQQHPIDRG